MPTPISDLSDDLKSISGRISDQVRAIALGILALVWALLTGMKDSGLTMGVGMRRELLGVALVAILAMVVDYLQYLCGYEDTLRVLKTAEREDRVTASYNARTTLYRARGAFFHLKQIVIIGGAIWLGSILLRLLT